METVARKILDPRGDDAATVHGWSDRYPATIVARTDRTIRIQEDRVVNLNPDDEVENGLAYARGHGKVVIFERDYDAPIATYTLRKNGRWIRKGEPMRGGGVLTIGARSYYRDPHF